MTEKEAKKSLVQWRAFEHRVLERWTADSPMANLARRRVLQAELRLLEVRAAERLQDASGATESA